MPTGPAAGDGASAAGEEAASLRASEVLPMRWPRGPQRGSGPGLQLYCETGSPCRTRPRGSRGGRPGPQRGASRQRLTDEAEKASAGHDWAPCNTVAGCGKVEQSLHTPRDAALVESGEGRRREEGSRGDGEHVYCRIRSCSSKDGRTGYEAERILTD